MPESILTPGAARRPAASAARVRSAARTGVGVLGVQSHFDGVALESHLVLCERQPFTGRHAQLPLDEVEPGDALGDRVLDLQPGIHFEEVVLQVGIDDELDVRGHVAYGQCCSHGIGPMRSRMAGLTTGEGASSITFCRRAERCSRAPRGGSHSESIGEHLYLDVPSASISRSSISVPSPKALWDSRRAPRAEGSSQVNGRAACRPPPPATALTSSGRPSRAPPL